MKNQVSGALWVLLSAAAFGAMPILARLAYQSGVDPVSLLCLRFTISGLIMLAWMLIGRVPFPRGRDLIGVILMGAVGYVSQSMAYFNALTLASASLVALLLYLYPVFVTVLSAIFLKEKMTPVKVFALALALCGSFLMIGLGSGGQPLGIVLGVVAAVIYSIYILSGNALMSRVPPMTASAVIMMSAGVVYSLLAGVRGMYWPQTTGGWAAVIGLAVISTVLAMITFFIGLNKLGPTRASTLSTFEPVVSVALAALVLGEPLTFGKLAGGALILAAVVLLTLKK